MTRILLIGKNGQIGWELNRHLIALGDLTALGRNELDITDRSAVRQCIQVATPDIIINSTGYNNVDAAEDNADLAYAVNKSGAFFIAEEAALCGAFLISFSSDYVFDGKKNIPYIEDDETNPINVYGRSKLEAEKAIKQSGVDFLIFRTSSVYSLRRACFLTRVLDQIKQGKELRFVTDLVSSPTSARYLAEVTAQIIRTGTKNYLEFLRDRKGVYNLAGEGYASRYEWAKTIMTIMKLDMKITPSFMADFTSLAQRPAFSALDSRKFAETFQMNPLSWQQMLVILLGDYPR